MEGKQNRRLQSHSIKPSSASLYKWMHLSLIFFDDILTHKKINNYKVKIITEDGLYVELTVGEKMNIFCINNVNEMT